MFKTLALTPQKIPPLQIRLKVALFFCKHPLNFTVDLTSGNFSWNPSIFWSLPLCQYDHFTFPSLPTGFVQLGARDYCLTALTANKLVSFLLFFEQGWQHWDPVELGEGISEADSLCELWGQDSNWEPHCFQKGRRWRPESKILQTYVIQRFLVFREAICLYINSIIFSENHPPIKHIFIFPH